MPVKDPVSYDGVPVAHWLVSDPGIADVSVAENALKATSELGLKNEDEDAVKVSPSLVTDSASIIGWSRPAHPGPAGVSHLQMHGMSVLDSVDTICNLVLLC